MILSVTDLNAKRSGMRLYVLLTNFVFRLVSWRKTCIL